jgi:glycosyltransferase involved in cell wall biosynthesis
MLPNKHHKILYVIPSLSPGGAEHETIDQVNYLYKKNHNVYIVVLSNQIELYGKLELPKSHVFILNLKDFTTTRFKNLAKFPIALKRINKIVKTNQITTIMGVLPLSHILVRLHQCFYKTDYRLWCFHKSMQYQATPLSTFPKKLVHLINKTLSKQYDYGHIFISEAVKQNISDYLTIKNGVVLHNAVLLREVSSQLAKDYLKLITIELPQYLVVVPGRLHPTKGHAFFVKSMENYIKKYASKDLSILFVGGGPLKNELSEVITKANLQEHIIITDYVDNKLMLSFLALANLVVIPSIHEGFGNVAIETLMQGSTILASDTGGLPEIINHGYNGFLFKTLDATDLKEKFITLHNKTYTTDSNLLKADFEERFTIDAQMLKLINVIS